MNKGAIAVVAQVVVVAVMLTTQSPNLIAATVDWRKVAGLQDQAFLDYVRSLDLHGQEAIDFWKKIPLSAANPEANRLFRKDAFAIYMNKYPRPPSRTQSGDAGFEVGLGAEITGPLSGQSLKLPFSNLYSLPDGPIGDPSRTYRIGYSIHGLEHPWLLNNADSAMWEANRHPNVELTVLDGEFDNNKQVEHIDGWVHDKLDGILVWPMQEAPAGPPIARATSAGIPAVSIDRMVGTRKVTAQVTGNFPANGAQQGAYLIHRLVEELGEVRANILMIRKPHGSTADAMRTGHFLKAISYFPGLKIVESEHNSSNRAESLRQVSAALEAHEVLDVIFCTGAEQAMGAVAAVDQADRWNSRENNRRIIILSNDDLQEALVAMQEDKIAVTAPYTPLLGGLSLRVLLRILAGEKLPRDIITPDLPMITKESQDVFGIQTMSVEQWAPYAYGQQ